MSLMVGLAAAGLGMQAAGSIFGGIQRAKAARKMRRNVRKQMQKNEDWYNRRYNEDATQRADAQRLLNRTEQILKDRNKYAQGAQAVNGGTEEGVAVQKAQSNQVLADAVGQISAANEQRKDAIEQRYLARQDELDAKMDDINAGAGAQMAQAVQGLGNVASGIASVDWSGLQKGTPKVNSNPATGATPAGTTSI